MSYSNNMGDNGGKFCIYLIEIAVVASGRSISWLNQTSAMDWVLENDSMKTFSSRTE